MTLPFFFEENLPIASQFTLSEESSKHIAQVLRMKEGQMIQITNGKGDLLTAEIILPNKKTTRVKIIEKKFISSPHGKITIAVSLIKNPGRFEWFLEKATEIGVSEIIPLLCRRTEKPHFKQERMKAIVTSAMLQSRQAWLPAISEPVKIGDLLQQNSFEQKLIAHCADQEKKRLDHLNVDKKMSRIILIGPEGDFTEDEIAAAQSKDYIAVSLGENRLRTETAAIVAAVLLK